MKKLIWIIILIIIIVVASYIFKAIRSSKNFSAEQGYTDSQRTMVDSSHNATSHDAETMPSYG